MNLCLEYLDALAKYWVARAQSDYINTSVCGSTIMDFIYDPIDINKFINNAMETLNFHIYRQWPRGYPINSTYIALPLYMRTVFPLLKNNGMAKQLNESDRKKIKNETRNLELFTNSHVKNYGLAQFLNFNLSK